MTHKALIRRLQISCLGLDRIDPLCLLVDDVIAALAQQEPVALQDDEIYDAAFSAYCRGENSRELFRIMWSNRLTCSIGWDRDELKSFARNIAALYTTPPQRTWVGLTDEEIFETHKQVDSMQYLTFANAIEAKLKELNT